MKRWTFRAVIAVSIVVAFSQGMNGQQDKAPKEPQQKLNEKQLEDRFNEILAKEFDSEDVSLSFEAARQLDSLVRNAATEIIMDDELEKLPLADKDFNQFAIALRTRAKIPFGETKITPKVIDEVLNGKPNPIASDPTHRTKGLCPLFPICK